MIRFLSHPGLQRLTRFFNLDVALRYLMVRDRLGTDLNGRILEVGSAGEGLARYTRTRTIAVEPFPGAMPTRAGRLVIASGAALPFGDRSFDTVVSVDVLEHVLPQERTEFVRECLRVADRRVLLVFPSGEASERQDRELAVLFGRVHGTLDQSLAEHVANGLPDPAELLAALERLGRRPSAVLRSKSLNLRVRGWIMRRWINRGIINLVLYRLAVVLVPIRRRLNIGPCYRTVLDIHLAG